MACVSVVVLESNTCYWETNRFWTYAATVEKQKKFTGNDAYNFSRVRNEP